MTTEEILDAISGMTVLEVSELVKAMEEKFGVTAAAPVVAAAAPGGGADSAEAEAEEQTEFDVVLTGFGDDRRYQGSAGHHRAGPERGEGSR